MYTFLGATTQGRQQQPPYELWPITLWHPDAQQMHNAYLYTCMKSLDLLRFVSALADVLLA